jgi:hypothetical protein
MQIGAPEVQRNTVFGVHIAICQAFSTLKVRSPVKWNNDSPILSKKDTFEKCTHLKNATFENKMILKSARLEKQWI